ncbi:AAA family ATPase [Hyphomicrobium sp. D-2]|uniref:AAA family ATPase n=1 Tax=Hyphomicrobium sp. D-2 TaxID=3041621 RepID=UPI0024545637|nr:AAA family ATPase [Hyphomicrobium sp. D-2]MDH4982685.1 AAA family ATPase [Hyphomicrobium sp. D-2]
MKIKAIRLKEVGRFSAPVALEGLSGGLDVLSGPNEFGKSTIMRALQLVLFEQHRGRSRKLEAFRPYSGGAPLIELDFEARGKAWRLRKQFLSSPLAELRDLQSNNVARGADAELRLAELIEAPGNFALLYAEQGLPLAQIDARKVGGAAFLSAIEAEIENVADGSVVRTVADRVRTELATLMTAHAVPRPTGELKRALDERESLDKEAREAGVRLAEAQARLDRLEGLRAELDSLTAPGAGELREARRNEARDALAAAVEARNRMRAAEQARKTQEENGRARAAVLKGYEGRLSALAKCEEQRTEFEAAIVAAEQEVLTHANRKRECQVALDELKQAVAAGEAARKLREMRERRAQLDRQLGIGREAEAAIAAGGSILASNRAKPEVVKRAQKLAAEIAGLEARLQAAAPSVTIALDAGAAGKLTSDGRALQHGEQLTPTHPIVIDIAGIGSISIAPGRAQNMQLGEAELADRKQALAVALDEIGATSLDDAVAQAEVRQDASRSVSEATARLDAIAPRGIAMLEQKCSDLDADIARLASSLPEEEEVDISDARIMDLQDRFAAAETALTQAVEADRAASHRLNTLQARLVAVNDTLTEILRELGSADDRAARLLEMQAAVATAETALNAAVREVSAWREQAPDETCFESMQQAAEQTQNACEQAARRIGMLREQTALVEGMLRRDHDDDIAARLAELNDRLKVADNRCCELQKTAAALQLLSREFDEAAKRTRDQFTQPVLQRMMPYLEGILPGAALKLNEDLVPSTLLRGGGSEDLDRLSDGTQEQLQLLVRLAFGRLLADRGTPAPLLLDDPLIYASDGRLQAVFNALRTASEHHQVLVTTCRERAFQELGGQRVALQPWHVMSEAA